MEKFNVVVYVLVSFLLSSPLFHLGGAGAKTAGDGSEAWGYVQVRPKAHMFWWHYKSPYRVEDPNKPWPIILWLQGGPGASGVGIGNFQEIGPLDVNLEPRNSTWLKKADLLFVKSPLYIVAESYGGKFAVTAGLSALKAIEAGKLKLKLGENSIANQIKKKLVGGKFEEATTLWSKLEDVISAYSNSVDFYNFMLDSDEELLSTTSQSLVMKRYKSYLGSLKASPGSGGDLDSLMNGAIKKKLKIIPPHFEWGEQSGSVFDTMAGDFMRPRINEVDELLSKGVNVTIYNGQVDLICATKGTEAWVQKLKWEGLKTFKSIDRTPMYCGNDQTTRGFTKSYKNLHFYWILGAGHFVSPIYLCHSSYIYTNYVTFCLSREIIAYPIIISWIRVYHSLYALWTMSRLCN
nr:serine carboxypeptidase-like 51 [Ipomoea batatas]